MRKSEMRGRSRKDKHHLFRKGLNQARRVLAAVIGVSMITTSVGSTTVWAAEIPSVESDEAEEQSSNFVFDKEELSQALLTAVKGKSVKDSAFSFKGREAETYDELFKEDEDGCFYELQVDVKSPIKNMDVKVYARLETDADTENYIITGNEEIYFLLVNKSSEEKKGFIEVDGNISAEIPILSTKTLKEQLKEDEIVTAPTEETSADESQAAGDEVTGESKADGEKTETPEETEAKEPESKDDSSNQGNTEEAEKEEDKKEDKKEESEKKDTETESDKNQDADSEPGSTETKDDFSKGDSTQENEDKPEEDRQDEVRTSRSEHFQMFLMAAPATPGEIQEEDDTQKEVGKETDSSEESDQPEEKNMETQSSLDGIIYESVLFKNTAAAAFVATAVSLGLADIMPLTDGKGSLTISTINDGIGTSDADTEYEFKVTKEDVAAAGSFSIDGGTIEIIPADGKIILKSGQKAVLTELEPGDYVVEETKPTQDNYKATSFSVNNGPKEDGLVADVTVTAVTTSFDGGWDLNADGDLNKDEDGYFTYTLTSDQIDAEGNITVDCDPIAEYMEAEMQGSLNQSSCDFKLKFVNETGVPIQYQDYSFDTVNWIPVGDTYEPSGNPTMMDSYYGWGEVWQQMYNIILGQPHDFDTLPVKGFDGENIRLICAPLRCINPAVISYFKSNSGKTDNLTGNSSLNNAGYITLKQMNAFPELIKKSFTFKNSEGSEITLPADENRTYADFICKFYGVDSLDDLTIAQKYNVLGTGAKGSPALDEQVYKGQSAITIYHSVVAPMTNRYIPTVDLNDETLNYFKTWGFGKISNEYGYSYDPDFYLLENDPEILEMAYDFLYSRCIRFSLDDNTREVSESFDNSASPKESVGGIKEYMDKTDAANAHVQAAMNNGEEVADGQAITLDHVKGYIEVPNAWNQFRYFDFGFKVIFKTTSDPGKANAASVAFTNTYEGKDNPSEPEKPKPEEPKPEEPKPGNGGGHGGHGGGGGSSKSPKPTVTPEPVKPEDIPIEVLPKTDPEPIEQDIPLRSLPKTGDETPVNASMLFLTIGMMAAAYVLMTGRKEAEEK